MLPKHSCFGAIEEEHFLEGTPLLSSLEKMNSSFLRKEFRKDCCRFFEDQVSTILSTVAAHYPVGQGLSCFCPENIIGGDDYSAFYLFGQLLDGSFGLGWVRRQRLNLQSLNSTLSSANSDKWKCVAKGLVCRTTASLGFAISLASGQG